MNYNWYDFVGNIGVLTILACYFLLHIGKMNNSDLRFSIFNGLGALFVLISLIYEFNLSAFLVEFFWLLISIMGGVRWLKQNSENGVPQK